MYTWFSKCMRVMISCLFIFTVYVLSWELLLCKYFLWIVSLWYLTFIKIFSLLVLVTLQISKNTMHHVSILYILIVLIFLNKGAWNAFLDCDFPIRAQITLYWEILRCKLHILIGQQKLDLQEIWEFLVLSMVTF